MNTASYSVLAKIHARYGRMLGDEDYGTLMVCRNLADFAAYLRGKRDYAEEMGELTGAQVNRGQLEFLLRENRFRDNILICMSLQSFGEGLAVFFIGLEEAGFILNILRGLNTLGDNPYISALPRAFYRYTKIDFYALKSAHDYASFLDAVRGSRYYPILKQHQIFSEDALDYTALESAIYRKLYGDFFKTAGKKASDLTDLISSMAELSNLAILYRAKKVYGDTADVSGVILPYWYKLDKNTVASLTTGTLKNFVDTLARTRYGGLVSGAAGDFDMEIEARRILCRKCVHTLHFSMDSPALALSYIQLRNIELRNLIIIIEGIRYNVGAQSVKRLLVY